MSYSLSKIGMDVFIPIRKTLLDITLVLLRPMNLGLWYQICHDPNFASRDGTYVPNQKVSQPNILTQLNRQMSKKTNI